MSGDDKDLVADEGVDEVSTESADTGTRDLTGPGAVGGPVNSEQQAAPEQIVTAEDETPQPGQRQQVGEG